ncbi:MAG TPA: oxidative damage protection protein [Candidatus Sulfotelmatobacter sp.]|nr:oxidative damage protection protein [Candidatus Sulfotelmatobacter sp.]
MAQPMVECAKLGRTLPGIDVATNEGEAAVVFLRSLGDEALVRRVLESVSMDAWRMWLGHLTMVINEFRLDPASEEANEIIKEQVEQFFFGANAAAPPGYVPPRH